MANKEEKKKTAKSGAGSASKKSAKAPLKRVATAKKSAGPAPKKTKAAPAVKKTVRKPAAKPKTAAKAKKTTAAKETALPKPAAKTALKIKRKPAQVSGKPVAPKTKSSKKKPAPGKKITSAGKPGAAKAKAPAKIPAEKTAAAKSALKPAVRKTRSTALPRPAKAAEKPKPSKTSAKAAVLPAKKAKQPAARKSAPAEKMKPVVPGKRAAVRAGKPLTITVTEEPSIPQSRPSVSRPPKRPVRIFLPEEGTAEEEPSTIELPEEYGQNELLTMAVDPNVLFVSWEIIPVAIAGMDGEITLRVYDVTGVVFNGINAHRFVDLTVQERVGSDFFAINMPGREAVIELGVVSAEGWFRTIMRSRRIAFPQLLAPDELGIIQKLSSSGMPVGY